MNEFIALAKLREHQQENADKKFLCTQMPKFVEWEKVYSCVGGNDLNSINFKAPNILNNYAKYKYIDPEFLCNIVGEIPFEKLKDNSLLHDYVNHVKPPAGKEVYSFFVHGQLNKPNFVHHVEHLAAGDAQEMARISQAIHSYVAPNGALEDAINLLQKIECGTCKKSKMQQEEEEAKAKKEKENIKKTGEQVLEHAETERIGEEEENWKNPVLEEFKIKNGLPTHFPIEKAIKQCLISKLSPTSVDMECLMSKYQNKIVPSTAENMEDLVWIFNHYPKETIKQISEHPDVQKFYKAMKTTKPTVSKELVKMFVASHLKNSDKAVNEEIIKLLI